MVLKVGRCCQLAVPTAGEMKIQQPDEVTTQSEGAGRWTGAIRWQLARAY